jgi:hypothetical protein
MSREFSSKGTFSTFAEISNSDEKMVPAQRIELYYAVPQTAALPIG